MVVESRDPSGRSCRPVQVDVPYFTSVKDSIIEIPWKGKEPYVAQPKLIF